MAFSEPTATLDARYSSPSATAREWSEADAVLAKTEIYWLSTVRPTGQPHVTPLIAIWLENALYFSTGAEERKAKNLAANPQCVLTTGGNRFEGLDVVVEGNAALVTEPGKLQQVADQYLAKYGWHFDVRDGALYGEGGAALLYQVTPTTVFAFAKSEPFSQTRWRF